MSRRRSHAPTIIDELEEALEASRRRPTAAEHASLRASLEKRGFASSAPSRPRFEVLPLAPTPALERRHRKLSHDADPALLGVALAAQNAAALAAAARQHHAGTLQSKIRATQRQTVRQSVAAQRRSDAIGVFDRQANCARRNAQIAVQLHKSLSADALKRDATKLQLQSRRSLAASATYDGALRAVSAAPAPAPAPAPAGATPKARGMWAKQFGLDGPRRPGRGSAIDPLRSF